MGEILDSVSVESVKIYGEKEMTVDGSQKLSAVVLPADADDRSLAWTSSDETIATVDENGNVTAVGIGTVRITASAQDGSGVSDTFEIQIVENPSILRSIRRSLGNRNRLLIRRVRPTRTTVPFPIRETPWAGRCSP